MAELPSQRLSRGRFEALGHPSDDAIAKAIWTGFGLLGILFAAYLGAMIVRHSWQFSPLLDGWLVIGFQSAACGLCFTSAFGRRRHRGVALLMGVACASWTIGDVLFTLGSLNGAAPATPSLPDFFFFGFFPIALVAVVLFVRTEITRKDAVNWLDGAIAALGMAAVCSLFVARGLGHLTGGLSLAVATNVGFPVSDLLLLGIVAGSTVFVASPRRAALVLIAVGITVNAAGDTINFVQPASGASQFSEVLNAVAWPFSIFMFAMAMRLADRGSQRIALSRLSGFTLPGIIAASSLGILTLDHWYRVGSLAVILADVTLVLAGVRLAFRPALRLARAQLRSSEERYRLLFEKNPLPMVTYDRETLQIVAASNAMIDAYGYTRDELQAMTVDDLRWSEHADPLVDATARGETELTGKAERTQYATRHRHNDGTIVDVEVTTDSVTVDGRLCRIALYNDVTQRNRTAAEAAVAHERAVEASNMKSAFLANVSHEVRTPMNGVIGMNELLLGTHLDGEQRSYAEQVERSGLQMLAIINDILDISKIEAGHLEIDAIDFDLPEMIKEAASAAGALARAKGLRLDLQIAPDAPRLLRGDGRRLRQVLANLLSNAVKFTATGAITVAVTTTPTSASGTLVRVEVADTGIGIDPERLHGMFEPFTQADVSTTRLYGGTGLGLAIAREIIELMGGTINAKSTPGSGSSFWFEVELEAASSGPSVSVAVPAGAPAAWPTPPIVLVAEDSQVNQIVAARVIERCGCRVVVVGDGVEALAALTRQHFDAVLMDCQMPLLDGYDATTELRRRERGARRTPVIAMTAHAMTGDRERCLGAGMDDYISKPVRHADLADALARWIPRQPVPGEPAVPSEHEPATSRPSAVPVAR